MRVIQFIKTIMMNLWVYPVVILVTIFGLLITPIAAIPAIACKNLSVEKMTRLGVWCYGRAWIATISPFVKVKRRGLDIFNTIHSGIITLNHLSYFDVYFMGALPRWRVGLTSRSWPRKMPWYSFFTKSANYLNLEASSYDEVSRWVAHEKAQGHLMVFFPEGHRSQDGRLQRFHSGAFKAAIDNDIPIIPLCIRGTDILLPKNRFWLKPCEVELIALPPVFPGKFTTSRGHVDLRRWVKGQMREVLEDRSNTD